MVAKLYAVRLAGEGIGVYEIRPGIIATEMTAPSKARYDAFFAEGRCPTPRWGEPAEVGRAVAACAAGDLPYTVGQPLLMLEAMKMENEIRAPRNGVVTAVHVQPGQTVGGQTVLVEIE